MITDRNAPFGGCGERGARGGFIAEPLTARCRGLAELAQHACVGISPFNSYFKRARVVELCQWVLLRFERVHFHLPDGPSQYTLTATGIAADKARRRAHENGLKMRNRIRDGLVHATGPATGLAAGHATGLAIAQMDTDPFLLDWEHLRANAAFQELHRQARHWFAADPAFRAMCLDASRRVLAHRMPGEPTEGQVEEAVRYFLADIPLLIDTPRIAGVETSVYVYHRTTPFVEALFAHRLPWPPSPRQGYLVLRPDENRATAGAPEN
ncbi:tRNA-dependent cyclodipeptide synthase [Streptomyces sp. NPDC047071]|uniref:tRNA-dependent cyclodipeptide synthase n=1 Tax=Streptomyces sp. NPDC047071 TaxID=3154808 RepID=UPI0034565033